MASMILDPLAEQFAQILVDTPCFASLHYIVPSADDPGSSEATGATYSRAPLTWDYASGVRLLSSVQQLQWLNLDGVTIIGIGAWDGATTGSMLLFAQLDTPVVVSDRGSYSLDAGALFVRI